MTDRTPQPLGEGESGAAVDRSRPRLLLLSYHFPPGPGTGGARWAKLWPLLRDRGWGLDVVTLDPACLADPEWDRLKRLPEGLRVYGAPQPRVWLERLEDVLGTLHGALEGRSGDGPGSAAPAPAGADDELLPGLRGVPVDAVRPLWSSPRALLRAYWSRIDQARQRAWIRGALDRARQVVDPGLHRIVATTGPPHLTHAGGRVLAGETDLPLAIDFRDPWKVTEVLPEHLASPVWLGQAGREEPRCVERASLVVANTEALRARLVSEYPEAADRIIDVPNGWAPPIGTGVEPPERFVIAYAGAIYLDRNPRGLMKAVASLAGRRGLSPDELSLEFMGDMEALGPGLVAMADQEGVGDHLRLHPQSPRDRARRFLSRASVLLSLPQSQTLAVPSKIFDYMTLPAWIVAQARPESATARMLEGTGADVVPPDDHAGLVRTLERLHDAYVRSGRPSPLAEACPDLRVDAVAEPLLERLERWRGPVADQTPPSQERSLP